MLTFIYTLTDTRTNEVRYIGKTTKPESRYRGHCTGRGETYCARWVRTLLVEGFLPIFRIVEAVPSDGAMAEFEWIFLGRAEGWPLTNLTDGGEGVSGFKFSDESRKKLSESQRGRITSEETKQKLSEAFKGNQYGKGYRHTEEAKRKISEANKNMPKDARARQSEAQRGKARSEETKHKISASLDLQNLAERIADLEAKLKDE
jgi:hypothetical protein